MNHAIIPFLDLVMPHRELEEDLVQAFRAALNTATFVGGPEVTGFEAEFAQFCGSKFCVGVNSGTDALRFAVIAAGVKRGESVITVPNTFIATSEAISQAGATPEFVDIDEHTYNMDPAKLLEYLDRCELDASGRPISRRTGKVISAVIPVHLYGQMADMDPIVELTRRFNLILIEDACQAHGAEYFSKEQNKWLRAGSIGHAAAFSFYPGKNLGACGEAGAITTQNENVARISRMLRDHGQAKKYYHDLEGYNGRLDAIQAAILRIKLKHLSKWNEQRRAAAKRYNQLFAGTTVVITPYEPAYSKPVYHLYVVCVPNREQLQKQLAAAGIGTGIHYPVPLHTQNAYEHLGHRSGDFPVTERVTSRIVSLPMFPAIGEGQQYQVVSEIMRVTSSKSVAASAA